MKYKKGQVIKIRYSKLGMYEEEGKLVKVLSVSNNFIRVDQDVYKNNKSEEQRFFTKDSNMGKYSKIIQEP